MIALGATQWRYSVHMMKDNSIDNVATMRTPRLPPRGSTGMFMAT